VWLRLKTRYYRRNFIDKINNNNNSNRNISYTINSSNMSPWMGREYILGLTWSTHCTTSKFWILKANTTCMLLWPTSVPENYFLENIVLPYYDRYYEQSFLHNRSKLELLYIWCITYSSFLNKKLLPLSSFIASQKNRFNLYSASLNARS
jgi:hypothetical protein